MDNTDYHSKKNCGVGTEYSALGDNQRNERITSPWHNGITLKNYTQKGDGTLPAAREKQGVAKLKASLACSQELLDLLTKLLLKQGGVGLLL